MIVIICLPKIKEILLKRRILAVALSMALVGATVPPPASANDEPGLGNRINHVLLVSIDGMHALDYLNCSRGVSSVNGGQPYCPHLAQLGETAINYLDASASKPSDSFPGLTAMVTGASPRTFGAFYDVAYDRSLAPPAADTGNGLLRGTCTPGVFNGSSTEYEEGIDRNQGFVNGIDGVTTASGDGGVNSIDPMKLPRDPANHCNPVFPWNFIRTNTIFGVIHAAGGYTAWSDKHPSYSSVAGPGGAPFPVNLDDYFSPEINSNVVPLPGVKTALGQNCSSIDTLQTGSWTDSFQNIQCYDTLKVNAILNEIDGFNHNHTKRTKVPTLFGMNFQAVSVGQKLIEYNDTTGTIFATGGYLDAIGTPSPVLVSEIQFVDASIGKWVEELGKQGLLDSTLIVITAKHGQSPVDSQRYVPMKSTGTVTTSPSKILDSCLPDSESNAGGQIGPTEDDVSLLWLKSSCDPGTAVETLETASPASSNVAGIGEVFWGRGLQQMFNKPGLPPDGDPRSPDIIVTPNIGVTYSGSKRKQAEHGGFSHDDTSVIMLVSNPGLPRRTVTSPVETMQVAPTILRALGLDPQGLQGVQKEGTQILPSLF
jgi:hypothetical protein